MPQTKPFDPARYMTSVEAQQELLDDAFASGNAAYIADALGIAVEGFFAILTKRRLKRGVFHSIADFQAAINRYLVEHNQAPKPFTWTKDPKKIIAAVKRGHQALDSIH